MIAAFFDVDRTLIPGTSMEQQFLIWLLRHGHLGPLAAIRGVLDVALRLPEARRQGYLQYHGYLAGWREEDVADWATRCFHERVLPRVSSEGAATLAEHRAAGHLTILLSGSIQPLVEKLGATLGADLAVGTGLEVVDGRYTGRLLGEHVASGQKVVRVTDLARQHRIDLARSYCYADHRSDLAMLERFGHPVPTNPDRGLVRIARERGWEVRRFRQRGKP